MKSRFARILSEDRRPAPRLAPTSTSTSRRWSTSCWCCWSRRRRN